MVGLILVLLMTFPVHRTVPPPPPPPALSYLAVTCSYIAWLRLGSQTRHCIMNICFLHNSRVWCEHVCVLQITTGHKPISIVILGESTDDEDDDEECVYECLYDSLPDSQEKQLKQQDSSLVKIAEVAERSIKKLRRNWSIKKDDLSKGLSKIKRSSKTLIEDVYTKEGILNLEQNILGISRNDF